MGERYLISGIQLGLLKTLEGSEKKHMIDNILDKQFIGNSGRNIDVDTVKVKKDW